MTAIQSNILTRLDIDTAMAKTILTGFIRDQIEKAGMKGAVIGLSGGIDSALSAYLSAEALGAENVLAVRMPYKTSSQASLTDAEAVIEDLGLPSITVPITDIAGCNCARYCRNAGISFCRCLRCGNGCFGYACHHRNGCSC